MNAGALAATGAVIFSSTTTPYAPGKTPAERRENMLTSKQRATLRGAANGLSPVFQIGKDGVNDAVVQAAAACLAKRELIKLRLLETSPVTAREAADTLAQKTRAEVVQVIGGTVVLFLKKKKDSLFAEVL